MNNVPPRVFISYSHDSSAHKDWVLQIATRLARNGVDVILDQWDLTLGSDLPKFMETGLSGAHRVIAICTDNYVKKANLGKGGVGYEKMILTGQLMADIASDRIIPLVRNNPTSPPIPTFLLSRVYIDFSRDNEFEQKYEELIRDIHGEQIKPRPAIGVNPFSVVPPVVTPATSFNAARYVSPANTGTVKFDCSNNDGRFVVGAGDKLFETDWSGPSAGSIIAYRDPPSIRTIALADGVKNIEDIEDARKYDISSRTRRPKVGEIVVWQNTAGYFLATKIESTKSRSHGAEHDELSFSYVIAPAKSYSFK